MRQGEPDLCPKNVQVLVSSNLAQPVYMMTEQPAQSIPSDNYLEKSLILAAYGYN